MFAVNRILARGDTQTVGVTFFPASGNTNTRWYDCPGRRVLPRGWI
jgi:hypothetical protein